MKNTGRGLGGAERRVATGSAGSSPAVPTTQRARRKRLRWLDAKLRHFDDPTNGPRVGNWTFLKKDKKMLAWDAERRAVRHAIKALAGATIPHTP